MLDGDWSSDVCSSDLFAMSGPLWLSGDQSLVFTASGTYFQTGNLNYVGTLGGSISSMSHSSSAQEAVALRIAYPGGYIYSTTFAYPTVYKRYTGSLLFPASDVTLPYISGQQAYGRHIFHAADDRHVLIVQTGSELANATALNYYLIID
jgi:hypothetical protein